MLLSRQALKYPMNVCLFAYYISIDFQDSRLPYLNFGKTTAFKYALKAKINKHKQTGNNAA